MFRIRVAITKNGEMVSEHFGHCDGYVVYDIIENEVASKEFLKYPGHKPGFLPQFLADKKVNLIISGGMGASAQELFGQNNICVIVGASGTIEDVLKRYLDETLESDNSVCHNEH